MTPKLTENPGIRRIVLIADTHLDAAGADGLIERVGLELEAADAILHAGDVTDGAVLDALGRWAPVHAVKGNNDRNLDRPERLTVTFGGVEIAMIHDSGSATGRATRLRRWFPTADVVVFGHSHLPWHETDVRDGHVQHHVNPGSAMQRRRAPTCTVAVLEIADGAVAGIRHVPVG